MKDLSSYEEYGWRGVVFDFFFKGYFKYNVTHQIDDITYILYDRFYLTQWVKRSPFIEAKYNKKQCKERLAKNMLSIIDKVNKRKYKIDEESKDLQDVFADMDSKHLLII